jgi:hypothetical protein
MDIVSFVTGLIALFTSFISGVAQPVATLNSLEKVDDYPLYVMHYYGDYDETIAAFDALNLVTDTGESEIVLSAEQPDWGCSLFAAFSDPESARYGRNFDWQFSPAVLLFTDPPDGYASVSMVDVAYSRFTTDEVMALDELPLAERGALLQLPYSPFDGMNETGLVIGMAAVSSGNMRFDPEKKTIGSISVIREILDHAATVDEAVAILEGYNIRFSGGPPLHYLIADASGRAALVEYYQGEMHVFPNETPYAMATNFLRASVDFPLGQCWRYDRIAAQLTVSGGALAVQDALDLLQAVSQSGTQWSIVYSMHTGEIDVVMGQHYDTVHTFYLNQPEAD